MQTTKPKPAWRDMDRTPFPPDVAPRCLEFLFASGKVMAGLNAVVYVAPAIAWGRRGTARIATENDAISRHGYYTKNAETLVDEAVAWRPSGYCTCGRFK